MVNAEDADLKRWQSKLTRVEQVQVRLVRLDAVTLVPALLNVEAVVDLDHYKEDVGSDGEDTQRWLAKLATSNNAATDLRATLTELDTSAVINTATVERLTPSLAQLTTLAGEADEDVKRWQNRIGASKDRAGKLRANLAALDSASALLTEAQIATLDQELLALGAIVGVQDSAVTAWKSALNARHESIAGLRKNLARLYDVTWVITSLRAAVSDDQKAF